MADDFASLIEQAQKLPEIPDELEGALPDVFQSNTNSPAMSSRVTETDGTEIPHGARHSYKYDCARLIIGQVQTGFDHGGPTFEDQDDSDRLNEIMDKSFQAKAVIFKKQESFLKDGTVVVWLEWAEPVTPAPKQDNVMGLRQLLSPESDKPDDLEDSEDSL